jgi:teichuronic acid biosynthesis glycosyltransferase TuaC
MGIDESAVQVISNGVDTTRFFPTEQMVAKNKLGIPEGRKAVVSVGNLYPQKSHDRLISAFAMVAGKDENLALYIIGEGWLRPKLELQIRELKMQNQIFLAGARPNVELALWFSAAELSCLASSKEGWPNVVSESIACGTAVVATDAGGVPEILTNPELGIVVPQNVKSLAEGLSAALATKWDRKKLVQHARERTWNNVALEVLDYFRTTLEKRRE